MKYITIALLILLVSCTELTMPETTTVRVEASSNIAFNFKYTTTQLSDKFWYNFEDNYTIAIEETLVKGDTLTVISYGNNLTIMLDCRIYLDTIHQDSLQVKIPIR